MKELIYRMPFTGRKWELGIRNYELASFKILKKLWRFQLKVLNKKEQKKFVCGK
jgi:hypothetical protein